jgi:cytochrome c peroxidase
MSNSPTNNLGADEPKGARLTTTGVKTLVGLLAVAAVVSCGEKHAPAPAANPAVPVVAKPVAAPAEEIDSKALKRFLPSGTANETASLDPAKIALGRAIFHDKRLSRGGETACSSCHRLEQAPTDGQTTSKGADGQRCVRGTSVAAKRVTPDQRAIVATMQKDPAYAELFTKAFPEERHPMTLKNVAEAVAAFERGLATESRWDRYIRGEARALSEAEKRGLKAFLDAGCQSCHSGPALGGTMFQKLGAVIPWPDRTSAEAGKSPAANNLVKVPSLKVATLFSRYFRESSSTKLRDSIQKMGYHQLGIQLSDEDVTAMAAWMQSLTGALDAAYVSEPQPPADTNVANLH